MGVILGTAAYMSPEQAKGRVVDRRADIWAFGAVLYEMLTGRRAFEGEDTSDTLAAVLRQDVDWTALPARDSRGRAPTDRAMSRSRRQAAPARHRRSANRPGRSAGASPDTVELRSRCGVAPFPSWIPPRCAIVAVRWRNRVVLEPRSPRRPWPVTRFTFALPEGQMFTGLSGRVARGVARWHADRVLSRTAGSHLRSLSEVDGRADSRHRGLSRPWPIRSFLPTATRLRFTRVYDSTLKRIAVTGGAAVTITKRRPSRSA